MTRNETHRLKSNDLFVFVTALRKKKMDRIPLILRDHSSQGDNPEITKRLKPWNAAILNTLYDIGSGIVDDHHLVAWFIVSGGAQFHYLIDVWGVDIIDGVKDKEWFRAHADVLEVMSLIFLGFPLEAYITAIKEQSSFWNDVHASTDEYNYTSTLTRGSLFEEKLVEYVRKEKQQFTRFLEGIKRFVNYRDQHQPYDAFYLDDDKGRLFGHDIKLLELFVKKAGAAEPETRHTMEKLFEKLDSVTVKSTIDAFHTNSSLFHYATKRLDDKERGLCYVFMDNLQFSSPVGRNGNEYHRSVLLLNVPEKLSANENDVNNVMFFARMAWFVSLSQMGLGEIYKVDFTPVVHPSVYVDFMCKGNQKLFGTNEMDLKVLRTATERRNNILSNYCNLSIWNFVEKRFTKAEMQRNAQHANLFDFGYAKSFVNPYQEQPASFNLYPRDFEHNYHIREDNEVVVVEQYHLLTAPRVVGDVEQYTANVVAMLTKYKDTYVTRGSIRNIYAPQPQQQQQQEPEERQQPPSVQEEEPLGGDDTLPNTRVNSPRREDVAMEDVPASDHEEEQPAEESEKEPVEVRVSILDILNGKNTVNTVVNPVVEDQSLQDAESQGFGVTNYIGDSVYDSKESQSQPLSQIMEMESNTNLVNEEKELEPERVGEEEEELQQSPQEEFSFDNNIIDESSNKSVLARYSTAKSPPNNFASFGGALVYWSDKLAAHFGVQYSNRVYGKKARPNHVLFGTTSAGHVYYAYFTLTELNLLFNIYRTIGNTAFERLLAVPKTTHNELSALVSMNENQRETPVNVMRMLTGPDFEQSAKKYPRSVNLDDGPFAFDVVFNVCTYGEFKNVLDASEDDTPISEMVSILENNSRQRSVPNKTTNWGLFNGIINRLRGKKEEAKEQRENPMEVVEEGESLLKGGKFYSTYKEFMQLVESSVVPSFKTPSSKVVDGEHAEFLERLALTFEEDTTQNYHDPAHQRSEDTLNDISRNWETIRAKCLFDFNTLLWVVGNVFSSSSYNVDSLVESIPVYKALFREGEVRAQTLKINPHGISLLYAVEFQNPDVEGKMSLDEQRIITIRVVMVYDGLLYNTRKSHILEIPPTILFNVQYLIDTSLKFFSEQNGQELSRACTEAAMGLGIVKDADRYPLSIVKFWKVIYEGKEATDNDTRMENTEMFWLYLDALYCVGVTCNFFKFNQVFYQVLFDLMDRKNVWDMPYLGGYKKENREREEAIVPGFHLWKLMRQAWKFSTIRKSSSVTQRMFNVSLFNMLQHYHFMIQAKNMIAYPVVNNGVSSWSIRHVPTFTLDTFGNEPIQPCFLFDDDDYQLGLHWIRTILQRGGLDDTVTHNVSRVRGAIINPTGRNNDHYYPFLSATILTEDKL